MRGCILGGKSGGGGRVFVGSAAISLGGVLLTPYHTSAIDWLISGDATTLPPNVMVGAGS